MKTVRQRVSRLQLVCQSCVPVSQFGKSVPPVHPPPRLGSAAALYVVVLMADGRWPWFNIKSGFLGLGPGFARSATQLVLTSYIALFYSVPCTLLALYRWSPLLTGFFSFFALYSSSSLYSRTSFHPNVCIARHADSKPVRPTIWAGRTR